MPAVLKPAWNNHWIARKAANGADAVKRERLPKPDRASCAAPNPIGIAMPVCRHSSAKTATAHPAASCRFEPDFSPRINNSIATI